MHVKTILRSLALAAVGFAVSQAAFAQGDLQEPIGTIDTCNLIAQKVLDYNGNPIQSSGAGTANFQTVRNSPEGEVPKSTGLLPVSIVTKTQSPQLGIITIQNDQTRSQPLTVAQSNQASSDFPASLNIQFFATATVESLPGVVFVSDRPIQLVNPSVTQLHPLQGELRQVGSNVFYSRENPKLRFGLHDARLEVTGHDLQ